MRVLLMGLVLALIAAVPANAHTVLLGKNRAQEAVAVVCPQQFTPKDYRYYASRVYRRSKVSKRAFRRLHAMHVCQPNYAARKRVGTMHRKYYRARVARIQAAARPAITPLMDCIMKHESTYNPLAQNGQYKGLAQWSPEAWARHGGLKYASTPHGASYWEQVQVLANGLRMYGCRDWCPFDPC